MKDYWVAGHLTGGLGNRLFQHAAAAGLAEKWNMSLVFYVPLSDPTNHGPFDSIFRLFPKIQVLNEKEESILIPEAPGCVFTYSPFPEEAPEQKNFCVDGWRQTELYFPKSGLFPDFQSALGQDLYKKHKVSNSESTWFIHVRLGDYLILPHHQINIEDYYKKAIQYIPPESKILLFSDSFDRFEQHLQLMFKMLGRKVEIIKEENELVCLYTMSQCWGGAIVANSTFSWWGAYFARQSHPNPEKFKAIYPRCWGKGLPPARDIVPSWGISIDNTV